MKKMILFGMMAVIVGILAVTLQVRVDHTSGIAYESSLEGYYGIEQGSNPVASISPVSYSGDGFFGRTPMIGSRVNYFQATLVTRGTGLVIYHLRAAL